MFRINSYFVIFLVLFLSACRGLYQKKSSPKIVSKDEKVKELPVESEETFWKLFRPELTHPWVDSVFNTLTQKEKIAQLFMCAAYSNRGEKHIQQMDSLVEFYKIGGLIFFQGGPVRQAILTNRYQSKSKIPLLIAMDAEWGLGMRLDSTINFPRQMTLGAISDNDYIFKMGKEIARQCKRLGVHINFAPVVDINSNSQNPVIDDRSFGENKQDVFEKSYAYMIALQTSGVLANAKHFPGHGDTDSDSHYELPVVRHTKERLDTMELYPFRKLITNGLMSTMVAHLNMVQFDTSAKLASTLSKNIITGLLKDELHFKGLIFTDALNMKAVSKYYEPGQLELLALLAGNDVLLFSENVPKSIEEIDSAIQNGTITEDEINEKVKKILYCKFWCNLNQKQTISIENLYQDLNTSEAKLLNQQLYEKAQTLIANENDLLPIQDVTCKFATLTIGSNKVTSFQKMVDNYIPAEHFTYLPAVDSKKKDSLISLLSEKDIVLVALHKLGKRGSKNSDIDSLTLDFLHQLNERVKVIVVIFGSPYLAKYFDNFNQVLLSYEDNEITRKIAPQVIFGAIESKGKLPVTSSKNFSIGKGISTISLNRLKYSLPEDVGMDSYSLTKIDSIVEDAIKSKTFPGCQVLVAKNQNVVYAKSYGFTDYSKLIPVLSNTLYDIASLTKVMGTLQVIMLLYEQNKINLDTAISTYLPELAKTNKGSITIKEILLHEARLVPFIEFWKNCRGKTKDKLQECYFFKPDTARAGIEVTPELCATPSMPDSIWNWVIKSKLLAKKEYVYSDVGYYILKKIAEEITHQKIEITLKNDFYLPLGLSTLGFNPLRRFPLSQIAPTENDTIFRKSMICGTVHDPGAAMMGGIAGHAGLFSNANDLAILLSMNMNNGVYATKKYFNDSTVRYFYKNTSAISRRALGWDKKEPKGNGPTSDFASDDTFGHSGFTGTCLWADPENNLIYIFLSNRTNPDAGNKKIIQNNVRTKIHDQIYRSILPIK